jgi:hypothetical protein
MIHQLPEELVKGAIAWRQHYIKRLEKLQASLQVHAHDIGPTHVAQEGAEESPESPDPESPEANMTPIKHEIAQLQQETQNLKKQLQPAPQLFLVSLRGPVRAVFATAHKVAAAARSKAAAYTGGCLHCEVRREPKMPSSTSTESEQQQHDQPRLMHVDVAQALPLILAELGLSGAASGSTACAVPTGGGQALLTGGVHQSIAPPCLPGAADKVGAASPTGGVGEHELLGDPALPVNSQGGGHDAPATSHSLNHDSMA